MVKKIVEAVTLGTSFKAAAAYAGISYETFRAWQRDKPAFSAAIEKAEADMAVLQLQKIEAASEEGSWQAAAWKLERKWPELYGKRLDLRVAYSPQQIEGLSKSQEPG